jgi:hypothetical protein
VNKIYIVSEIKRTALENGGMPLGKARFEAESGIKESDWAGVHWVRWGDALREAGFEPNQLNTAFEKEHLLRKCAELTLELGHIPVTNDFKIKRRQDRDFPSCNVFARLGSKKELVTLLADFCGSDPKFEPIVEKCREYLRSSECETEEQFETQDRPIGFVYLFKSGRFYKIGMTNSAGRREYDIGLQLPEKLVSVHVIRTDDPPGIEEYWHKRFATKRMNGEWFDLDAEDIRAFRRRKFM